MKFENFRSHYLNIIMKASFFTIVFRNTDPDFLKNDYKPPNHEFPQMYVYRHKSQFKNPKQKRKKNILKML
jgi:hypothetical protein